MPRGLLAGLSSLFAAACSSSSMQPKLVPCTGASAGQVSLAVAGYAAIDPTQTAGCAVFGPNASASPVQYLRGVGHLFVDKPADAGWFVGADGLHHQSPLG